MTRRGWTAALALFAASFAASFAAQAGLPATYQALVIQPSVSGERSEFDLTPALQRAQKEGKRLYVYLGANDCPYCRRYEAFLDKHAGELVPHFAAKYLVVDLRGSLNVTGPQLYLKAGSRSLAYPDFQRAIGDERARLLVYPTIWLFDAQLKPLMQMPSGAGTFETVPEQIEILQLVQ